MKTTLLKGAKTILKIGGIYCLVEFAFAMGQGNAVGTALISYEDDAMEQLDNMPSEEYTGIKALKVSIIKTFARLSIKRLSR